MKKFMVLLCFALIAQHAISQSYLKRPELSTPNPTTAEMTRFGLTPINQYTGKANISIPLYGMNFDGLNANFALSYDSGGVKVNQEATWVGLGWSLSGIPTIQHIVHQRSDIGVGKVNGDGGFTQGYCYGPAIPSFPSSEFLESLNGNTISETLDTQPDVFVANLYGTTIKFQLTQKAVTGTIKARMLSNSNAQITYTENGRFFDIIDENGFTYEFRHIEYNRNWAESYSLMAGDIDPWEIYGGDGKGYTNPIDRDVPVAWYVDKIISPHGKILEFNYYGQDEDKSYFQVTHPKFMESRSSLVCARSQNNGTVDGSNLPPPFGSSTATRTVQEIVIPKEILNRSTGERIVFNTSARQDIWPFILTRYAPANFGISGFDILDTEIPKLDNLRVFSPSGEITKSISFDQSYFNQNNISDPNHPQSSLRLKLDKVSVDGMDYNLDYHLPDQLPIKHSKDIDFWGFYNSANNQVRYPSINFDSTFCGVANAPINIQNGSIDGAMMGSKFESGRIGSLTKITFPTGGHSTFEYESNTIRISTDSTSNLYDPTSFEYLTENNLESGYPLIMDSNPDLKIFKIGGLRIKRVMNYDSDNKLLLQKTYEYGLSDNNSSTSSSGKLMNKLLYFDLTDNIIDGGNIVTTIINTSSANKVGQNNSAMGSHIGYDRVEEIIESNNGNETNGKTITYFVNRPNISLQPTTFGNANLAAEAPPVHYEDANGVPLKIETFDNLGNIKTRTTNSYDFKNLFVSAGHKIYYSEISGELNVIVDVTKNKYLPVATNTRIYYDHYTYNTRKYFPLLTQSKRVEYYNSQDSITHITINDYNAKERIRSTKSNISKRPNSNNIIEYYYPYDTDYNVSTYAIMSALNSRNRISSPVYVRRYSNDQFIGHEFMPYKSYNSLFLPTVQKFQKQDATLSAIEDRLEYLDYDTYGNLLATQNDGGAITRYIWGYEQNYPIAKIENAPENGTPINSIIDHEILQDPKATNDIVKTELNKLRNHQDYQSSFITSYAYKSGVGMTQSTDQKEYSMNYLYDDKERLTESRDNDLFLLSENKYKVVGESVPCTDCISATINTNNKYIHYKTQSVPISITLPNGLPAITKWSLDYGNGTIETGTGSPPTSFSHTYNASGLKIIRFYAYFSENEFITGNTNIRISSNNVPGADVNFSNIVTIGNSQKTARLTASIGAVITYEVTVGGGSSGHSGIAIVDGVSTSVPVYQTVQKTVTIPSSGYVDCSVEHIQDPNGGTGTTTLNIVSTTIGQIGSPNGLSVTCCF